MSTPDSQSQLPALGNWEWELTPVYFDGLNDDVFDRSIAWSGLGAADFTHDVHAVLDHAEDRVLVVEMRGRAQRDEELTAIGVRSGVGHR